MSGRSPLCARRTLAARTLLSLSRGGRLSPDVLLVETPERRIVVKDWAGRGRLRAALGVWLAPREARIYSALGSHPAVPRYLGRVDRHAFAVEHRPGPRISGRRPETFSLGFCTQLEAAVRGLHAHGVVHLDLRHRSNVRAGLDGSPVLVDFGAAVAFRPGGLAARWLLPWLARIDLRAVDKWRHVLRVTGRQKPACPHGQPAAGLAASADVESGF